jgi:ATP:ADP antiporter, AAA family
VASPRSRAQLAIAVWGATTFGALLASYSAFRPVRDALVLDGDPDQIPWLFTATFVAVSAVSPIWGAFVARFERRRLIPHAFHAFALCALAFYALVSAGVAPVTVGRVFYVWSSVFNLFVVSVFWSLLADLLGPQLGRDLYGPIAAGGTIGSVVGPALTKLLVGTVGVAGILVVSALLLELAVVGVYQVRRYGEQLAVDRAPPKITNGGAFAGLRHVARSPYLRAIVGYVLCTSVAATLVYLQQAHITKVALPDRAARTELFATIDFWVAAATFVVQMFVAPRVLRWVGPGLVLCVLPAAQAAGITVLALAPSLAALVTVQLISRTATHGLTRPARELLFTVVGADDKYRAKNVIDTMVYRLGDFSSAWLYKGLVAFAAGSIVLVSAAAPLCAAWLAFAAVLGAGFRRRVEEKQSSVDEEQPACSTAAASSSDPSPPASLLPAADDPMLQRP